MLTTNQLTERRKGIGASEVAAWLGLDPYRTLGECVFDKLGLLPIDESSSFPARIGDRMEPILAAEFEQRHGCRLVRAPEPYVHAGGILRSNIDWQKDAAALGNAPVECKWTTSAADTYGSPDDGENALPKKVLLQVTAQMVCAESDAAWVVAALNRFGNVEYAEYQIRRNDRLATAIVARLSELWQRHVIDREPVPDGQQADAEVLRRIERVPKSITVVKDPAEVMEWARLKQEESDLEKRVKAAREKVMQRLGTAEALYGPDNQLLATFYQTKDKQAFDMEAFEREHPELARKYTRTKPGHRMLLCKVKDTQEATT